LALDGFSLHFFSVNIEFGLDMLSSRFLYIILYIAPVDKSIVDVLPWRRLATDAR
jgi:hypothetical protein